MSSTGGPVTSKTSQKTTYPSIPTNPSSGVSFQSGAGVAAKIPLPMSKITINGEEIPLAATKKTVTFSKVSLFKKEERDKMSPEKRAELFERAGKEAQTKYDFMNLKLNDPEKLEDTYNLEMAIENTRENHLKYDVHDVFTIVKPGEDPTQIDKYEYFNLYKDYSAVTADEVAASNEFYTTMTEDPNNHWFCENLAITHDYFTNNVKDKLITKVNETYLKYTPSQRGGPLFFKIMIDILQDDSEEAAQSIIERIKDLKITDFTGENIDTVISFIRGSVQRLTNIKDKKDKNRNALPDNIANDVLKVFQTSSCQEFNDLFKQFAYQQRIDQYQTHTSQQPELEAILQFAAATYRRLYTTDDWTGVEAKSSPSGFTCFNCSGDDHVVTDCTKPKDNDRIKANKKIFYDNKKRPGHGGRGGSGRGSPGRGGSGRGPSQGGKWAPPTAEEKKNQNRRTINGKVYYYHFGSKRWRLVKTDPKTSSDPSPAAIAAAVAAIKEAAHSATNVHSSTTTSASGSGTDATNAEIQVAAANAKKQMDEALSGLLSFFPGQH